MVKEHRIDLLCLQETKKESINKIMCQALWGNSDFSWEDAPLVNSAGGIFCIWNQNSFKVESKIAGAGFILLSGKWGQESQSVHVINIYSPCNLQDKRGDFNNIRTRGERLGSSQRGLLDGSIGEFNNWIEELELEEAPWVGKSKSIDWGPKPFRLLDCWLADNSFKKLVSKSWSSNPQSGWGVMY
ncbi:hypothetical protein JHK84_055508 [Glycine max]|nr:hypothetical protein JHK86_055468 [Glycine max]KAG5074277.1 hypothetical protein JHK84_055508 [Glycine max]